MKQGVIKLFLKGMAMGLADSVPGVSGGTIALITGIYEELINSIKAVNLSALKLLFVEGPAAAWRHINGNFLLVLLSGILLSLIVAANTVGYLLTAYPLLILAFFIGLIIASCVYVAAQIKSWDVYCIGLLLCGVLIAVSLSFIPQASSELSLAYLFFCGALAICAMILPGISGAFILLLLGAYEGVLAGLRSFDFMLIAVFMAGCISGLIAFSNLLSYLFSHYKNQTLTFLLGILVGSLYILWPWRIEDELLHGRFHYFLPEHYSQITGEETQLFACLGLALFGFFLVYGLEKFSSGDNDENGSN